MIILILFFVNKYWNGGPDSVSITDFRPELELPGNRMLIILSVALGLLLPFIARLCWVPVHGWSWFREYLFEGDGEFIIISALNVIPAAIWYLSGQISKDAPLAFWFSIAGGATFLLHTYGALNLHSSSTAGVKLFFIPFYAIGAIGISWLLGRFICSITKPEKFRLWAAGVAGSLAMIYGVAFPIAKGILL